MTTDAVEVLVSPTVALVVVPFVGAVGSGQRPGAVF
jgi:hypothetical protein